MYFTPRGIDESEQRVLDCVSSQKFLEIVVSGKKVEEFFQYFCINKIAIVPYNHFGKCLARLLQNTGVEIECFADRMYFKHVDERYYNIPVESYDDMALKKVDAVVVTSNFYFNDIIDTLIDKGIPLENIIGINSVLFGMERLRKE